MRKYLVVFFVLLVAVGCATQVKKTWSVVGGSKADGTVRLAYEYTEFEIPNTDEKQALTSALKRCKAWGYKNAEPFDAAMNSCISAPGAFQACSMTRVTMDYQCTN